MDDHLQLPAPDMQEYQRQRDIIYQERYQIADLGIVYKSLTDIHIYLRRAHGKQEYVQYFRAETVEYDAVCGYAPQTVAYEQQMHYVF